MSKQLPLIVWIKSYLCRGLVPIPLAQHFVWQLEKPGSGHSDCLLSPDSNPLFKIQLITCHILKSFSPLYKGEVLLLCSISTTILKFSILFNNFSCFTVLPKRSEAPRGGDPCFVALSSTNTWPTVGLNRHCAEWINEWMIHITWNKHMAPSAIGLCRSPLNAKISIVRNCKTWDMPLAKISSVTSPLEKLSRWCSCDQKHLNAETPIF